MNGTSTSSATEAFFLATDEGQRFCLYHPPAPGTRPSGALIYVHPFAEEMNRSRRIAALQARAFAAAGVAVLQIDLLGCGDSSGDFSDGSWDRWKDDLALAWDWLSGRASSAIGLWGLRLGALLAMDFASSSKRTIDRLLLWQPVVSGESFLTQFLRTRLASDMLLGLNEKPTGTVEMRSALASGKPLEVGGYELTPALAAAIDSLKLADFAIKDTPIHWFEIVAEEGQQLPPGAARVADAWIGQDIELHTHAVPGERFWVQPEVSECSLLLSATTSSFY
jgi:exosortase A-associated hydrolase 2